jgi:beta-lactamase regulating signal transducer with metallopeptidase domain
MSALFVDSTFAIVVWLAIKATALLALAALLQATLYRRRSAATRHLVWLLAVISILTLPLLWLTLPEWSVPVRSTAGPVVPTASALSPDPDVVPMPANEATPVSGATNTEPAGVPSVPWTAAVEIYAAGMMGMLAFLIAQHWGVRRMARHAAVVDDADWNRLLTECAVRIGLRRPVRLLRNRESTMPITFGTRHPAILIPAIADSWPDDRRRAVLLHELAHVVRYDCLTQTLAYAACAVYWMHPAAWWVARRLRIERELACDDRVIEAGTEAREYAGHLLEIAYAPSGQRAPALALGMRSHHLEGRMRAALDTARKRNIPGGHTRLAAVTIVAVLVTMLAAARPTTVVLATEARPDDVPPTTMVENPQAAVVGPQLEAIEWPWATLPRRALNAVTMVIGFLQDVGAGTWEIRPGRSSDTVNLRMNETGSSFSSNVPLDRFEGLTASQLAGTGGPVMFQMRRDAGTFIFEGILRNGVGGGTFSFKPDPGFGAELAKRGFARPTAREQYRMARSDVGFAFIDELNRQGYARPQTSGLIEAADHGVDETYLREMGALGYRLGQLAALVTLRDHGVTPSYVRSMQELGYKGLSADELRNARDHGVSAEYVRGMRDAGYTSLSLDELITARDHGVSAEYVRHLADAGHRGLPLERVITVRDHGVSAEYIRELREQGYTLPLDELVRARDHGVSVEFVREMAALGYRGLSMEALIQLRDHGVSAEYVREIKALGYDRVTPEELRMLRDHGVTPDKIRAANARAGTRLPIDMLKALAAGGMR